jgi:predicted nucleotide-binding protein (sugar kinase/HSP70/actin superfamily)
VVYSYKIWGHLIDVVINLEAIMKIGIPKGLLYYKYYPFFKSFFEGLNAEVITSTDTNKHTLDEGVKYCVDEACLPVKVFHGHAAELRGRCDIIFVPRIMQLCKREYICPKFCGLPEMVKNSIPNLPIIIDEPIYAYDMKMLYKFAKKAGGMLTRDKSKIKAALYNAVEEQRKFHTGYEDEGYTYTIALLGHPYNIFDSYVNMNLIKKLNSLGVGVITEENVSRDFIEEEARSLFKRPFWTFAKNSYGSAAYFKEKEKIDGIIYISSFACGIDSVVLELIKDRVGELPLLLLKIDEHTGEAGLNTRLEAYVDMMERRVEA